MYYAPADSQCHASPISRLFRGNKLKTDTQSLGHYNDLHLTSGTALVKGVGGWGMGGVGIRILVLYTCVTRGFQTHPYRFFPQARKKHPLIENFTRICPQIYP